MEALLYDNLTKNKVRCRVCNHYCIIDDSKRGICGVRENKSGILYALNYGKCVSNSIDPIEKKPLNHYLKHSKTYSFCTVGCNMKCPWCQNHKISQQPKPNKPIHGKTISPLQHINLAIKYGCPSISYTYNEPTIFLEYSLETMKTAHKFGLKNIWVSNGYMSKETLDLILPYLDAINIDYKGDKTIYEDYTLGDEQKILNNIKTIKDYGVHIEVTTLIIPNINDNNFIQLALSLQNYAGLDTPWHLSRFFPNYKMLDTEITPRDTMITCYNIAKEIGFKYIHLGNM